MTALDKLLDALTPGRKALRELDKRENCAKADLQSAFDDFANVFERAAVQGAKDLGPKKVNGDDHGR